MPHFSCEYSANLEQMADIKKLCDIIRQSAIETGLFPMPGIREYLQPALDKHSIAVSVEMRDIDASLSPKTGTIREHLPA